MLLVLLLLSVSRVQGACFHAPGLVKESVYLDNCLQSVLSAVSFLDCVRSCLSSRECCSFGFQPHAQICHLHLKTSFMAQKHLAVKMNWLHSDIDIWPKVLLGACQSYHCSSGEHCTVNAETNVPQCDKDALCPPPRVVPHATVTSGDLKEGSVTSYTCQHGYLDTSLGATSMNATCLKNGSWSRETIQCTGPYIQMKTTGYRRRYRPSDFTTVPRTVWQQTTGYKNTFLFQVKTCRDANLLLYITSKRRKNVCEIAIGGFGSTRSIMRQYFLGPKVAEHVELGVVSCTQFKPFWLSWSDGVISVGKGQVKGVEEFLKWTPPYNFTLNSVCIGSYGVNRGEWLFVAH